MLKALKSNNICTIMPDGPKGPRHQFKIGGLLLAMRSDVYILPMTFAASKPIILHSWDRFTLWWPFSRLCLLYGEPFKVPGDLSPEEKREERFIQWLSAKDIKFASPEAERAYKERVTRFIKVINTSIKDSSLNSIPMQ
jgi:lysophospholipid acyltransferase (LPLAT)-like uncharacterized protein